MTRRLIVLAALALAGAAHAQTYPTKPIKLIVPFWGEVVKKAKLKAD